MQTDTSIYTDFSALTQLKKGAREESPEAIKQVAKQFESLFVQMMLKGMRDTLPENELFGSNAERMYQDMYDKQLSLQISNGKGMGLAKVIERQLGGVPETTPVEKSMSNYLASPVHREASVNQNVNSAVTFAKLNKSAEYNSKVLSSSANETNGAWQSAEDFVKDVWPYAQRAAETLGVDAEVLMAQSALETGWGKHLPLNADGSNSFNLFGIKADQRWQGERVEVTTREFRHGAMQHEKASFRSYDSAAQSFDDYVDFIMHNPRYQKALEHGYDASAYARELQSAGYATDPNYAKKINRIRGSDVLQSQLSRDIETKSG